MNGVYDALPDTVKLIDGNEDPGYKAATSAHMDKCVSDYYFNAKRWIDAKNLPKFYRSTSLSCSLYLDSYMPDNPHPYQLWKTTDNQARLLQDNVTHILEHSDEYAWIWGEKGTFFPQLYPTHRFKYWNERLPMTREAIEAGKDPYGTAKKYAGENLLQNSELNSGVVANDGNTPADNKGLLPHWASWIDPKTGGKIRPVNGTVCFSGTSNACIIQYYTGAESNTRYLLTARCKLDSTCTVPTLGVNFYDAEKKGIWSLTQRAVFSEPDGDGWRTGELLFDSPDFPMAYMGLTVSTKAPKTEIPESEQCFFDDVKLYKIVYPWDSKATK